MNDPVVKTTLPGILPLAAHDPRQRVDDLNLAMRWSVIQNTPVAFVIIVGEGGKSGFGRLGEAQL